MAISAGTWLGQYEVLSHIGSGGMGEGVSRAWGNTHQGEVALKVLPEMFARDPERVAQFRRGAQPEDLMKYLSQDLVQKLRPRHLPPATNLLLRIQSAYKVHNAACDEPSLGIIASARRSEEFR